MSRKRIEHRIVDGVELKYCFKCRTWKNILDFTTCKTRWDKLQKICRICNNAISGKWHKENPEKVKTIIHRYRINNPDRQLQSTRKHLYGVTKDELDKLWITQKGNCAICNTKLQSKESANLDHSHRFNYAREFLCGSCNNFLGFVYEDVSIMASLINYLKRDFQQSVIYYRNITRSKMGQLLKRNMLIEQNYTCSVCGCSLEYNTAYFDHSHITGYIRSCLCNSCNSATGFCKEDITIIQSAIAYINKWEYLYFMNKIISIDDRRKAVD